MRPMQTTHRGRLLGALRMLVTIAGAILGLGVPTQNAWAQTAAQRAALAHLGGLHSQASSQSGTEATNVPLDQPSGVAFDAAGNLYIADAGHHVVREVDLAGVITIVAGTGEQGFGGDGGPASSALLDSPTGVVVGPSGDLYIADTHNHRIRKVTGGVIATIAGTGTRGFSGDGATATATMLDQPTAIAIDTAGNVYIADTNNHRIREISGTTITTVAGDGSQIYSGDGGLATAAGLDSPNGVALDATFNLYIGDTHNQRVRVVTAATGVISTLAGTGIKGFADGTASAANLARPRGVAVDSSGTVCVADSDNNRIRSISGNTIGTIAGNGSQGFNGDGSASTNATLDTPRAVAVSGPSLVIADTESHLVREVSGGAIGTVSGQPSFGAESLAISGDLSTIYGTSMLTANFTNGSNTGTGLVTFYDGISVGPSVVGSASLSGNTAVLNTSLLSAGTHRLIASYAGDANNPAITSGVYVLVVTPAATQTTLTASSPTLSFGESVTLTATVVSSTSGIPTGSVSFYDGATLLNATPATMNSGTTTLALSTLQIGTRTLTAMYNGDTNFLASTSAGLSEAVVGSDFTIAAGPTPQTVLPLQSVNYAITLTPSTSVFTDAVSLSVSGLPAGVTASFNPSSIAAGASASTTVLTLSVGAQAQVKKNRQGLRWMAAFTALPLLILPMGLNRRTRKIAQLVSRTARGMIVLFVLAAVCALASCGEGTRLSPSLHSYTVTVTAVSGPNTHTADVTLIVQ